jgi:predicted Zn-ribbon and HTH transcriptional regulator
MAEIQGRLYKCNDCGWEWYPRPRRNRPVHLVKPTKCPRCQVDTWDQGQPRWQEESRQEQMSKAG